MKEEAIVSSQASTLGCVLSFAVYIILIDCVLHCLNNSLSLGLLTKKKKIGCFILQIVLIVQSTTGIF